MSGASRPKFPGRVSGSRLVSAAGVKRIRSKTLFRNIDTVNIGENVARGLKAFYSMVGSSENGVVKVSFNLLIPLLYYFQLRKQLHKGKCQSVSLSVCVHFFKS